MPRAPVRRHVLARVPMREDMLRRVREDGQLAVSWSREPASTVSFAQDGGGARLHLASSGRPVQLEVFDWMEPEEDHEIAFAELLVSLLWREDELWILARPGAGAVDPWWTPRAHGKV